MKKKFLVSCILILGVAKAIAQAPFMKSFCESYATDVIQNSDSGYVVLSENWYFAHYDIPYFDGNVSCSGYHFLDSNGDSLRSRCVGCIIPTQTIFSALLQDSNFCLFGAGYFVYPDQLSILKMDNAGDTIWYHSYPYSNFNHPLLSIRKSIDSSYICLTNRNCFKINFTGDTVWTMLIDSSFSNGYLFPAPPGAYTPSNKFLAATTDTGFIIFRNQYNPGKFVATKFNSAHAMVWTKEYFIPRVSSLAQTADGSFILSCNNSTVQSAIVKLDQNADSAWTKWFPYEQYNSVEQTSDNGFIVACGIRFKIIKTDANGDTLWTSILIDTDSTNSGATHARETLDHGFIVSGFRNSQHWSDAVPPHYYSYGYTGIATVIKTDSLGNNVVNVEEISKPAPTFYPNPFTTIATISFGKEVHGATFILYNLLGEKVTETSGINGKSFRINRAGLQSGMYVYDIREKNKTIGRGKAVIY